MKATSDAELARRFSVPPAKIDAGKKQFLEHAEAAFTDGELRDEAPDS